MKASSRDIRVQEIMGEWEQEGAECRNTDGWISKGMWMKVNESQAGSGLPSGEEDRATLKSLQSLMPLGCT